MTRALLLPLLLLAPISWLVATLPATLPSPVATASDKDWPREVKKAFKTIKEKECLNHVKILASEQYEGRACGSEGGRKAGEYVAARFREIGLEPGGVDGTYFQPFSVRLLKMKEGPLALTNRISFYRKPTDTKAIEFDLIDDFLPHADSSDRAVAGSLSFINLATPIEALDPAALQDTVALALPGETEITKETLIALSKLGVRGLMVLESDKKKPPFAAQQWPAGKREEAAPVVTVYLTYKSSDKLLKKVGSSVTKAFAGTVPSEKKLKAARVELEVARKGYMYGRGRNVIGMIPGTDPTLREECIVIGAHYDHVGRPRDRRMTKGKLGEIHNGADDNASGTTGLIELAEAMLSNDIKTKRTIVLIAFDAEELGLLGSKYYVADPPVMPIKKTMAMINMDMISRNGDRDMKIGKKEEFAGLNDLVHGVAAHFNIKLDPTDMQQYMNRSDQAAFIDAGVPAVFLYGGDHPEYHTERDDVELISPKKIANIARLMFLCAYECANHDGTFK